MNSTLLSLFLDHLFSSQIRSKCTPLKEGTLKFGNTTNNKKVRECKVASNSSGLQLVRFSFITASTTS